MENQPAAKQKSYVGLFLGHEHASHPSISNQIGTSRIPILKSIILKGQNMVLTYPRGGLRGKYLKIKEMKQMNFYFLMFLEFFDIK